MPVMIPDYYYKKERNFTMAFVKKIWTDRIAEYINRRTLTKEDGTTELVTVARNEGTISQEGDAFNADTMNDLEQRINDEFDSVNSSLAKYELSDFTLDNMSVYAAITIAYGKLFTNINLIEAKLKTAVTANSYTRLISSMDCYVSEMRYMTIPVFIMTSDSVPKGEAVAIISDGGAIFLRTPVAIDTTDILCARTSFWIPR